MEWDEKNKGKLWKSAYNFSIADEMSYKKDKENGKNCFMQILGREREVVKGAQAERNFIQGTEALKYFPMFPQVKGKEKWKSMESSKEKTAVQKFQEENPAKSRDTVKGKRQEARNEKARMQEKKTDFLGRYRQVDMRIQRKCREMSLWRQRALQITPIYSELPGGRGKEDKIQSAVDHICEIEEEINRDIDELVMIREQVQKAIHSVKDQTLETLLEYRYIDGLTWEELAEKMHYSYQWVCRLHGKALECVVLPEEDEKRVDSN